MTNTDPSSDQLRFWQAVIQAIAGQAGVDDPTSSVVMASTGITCHFGDRSEKTANAQLADLGNTIPPWSLTWGGDTNDSFFKTYQLFINEIHPQPAGGVSAAGQKQLDAITDKMVSLTDHVDAIRKQQYLAYIQDNTLPAADHGTPGARALFDPSASGFQAQWKRYQQSAEYQAQAAELRQSFGQELAGLQDQHDTLAEQVFGPGYQEIAEAKSDVTRADPDDLTNDWSSEQRTTYQMQVSDGGTPLWQPRFTLQQGETYASFKAWVAQMTLAAENGQPPEVTVVLDSRAQEKDTSQWKFAADATIPVEDIFMVGVNAAGSGSTLDVSKYEFTATLTYQGIRHVPLGPSPSWYQSALLGLYRDFPFPPNSPFAGKALWGPQGIFNLRVAGIIVAYQPCVRMEVTNWAQSDAHTTWSESGSFSILGLINLGSESASGKSATTKYTSTGSGFELKDTSGEPKIVALVLETLPPGSSEPLETVPAT